MRRTPGLTVASGVLTPGNQPAVPLGAALSQTVCHRAPRSLAPLVAAPITPEAAPAGDAGFLSAILPGRRAEQQTAHTAWLARVTAQLQDRCDANTRVMHAQYPSAAHCLQDALAGRHLWQRNPAQADFLTCRAGLGDVPSGAALALPADAPPSYTNCKKNTLCCIMCPSPSTLRGSRWWAWWAAQTAPGLGPCCKAWRPSWLCSAAIRM